MKFLHQIYGPVWALGP